MPGLSLNCYSLYSVSLWTWRTPIPASLASQPALRCPLCLLSARTGGSWHAHACPSTGMLLIQSLLLTLARKVFYPSHLPNPGPGPEHTACMYCHSTYHHQMPPETCPLTSKTIRSEFQCFYCACQGFFSCRNIRRTKTSNVFPLTVLSL